MHGTGVRITEEISNEGFQLSAFDQLRGESLVGERADYREVNEQVADGLEIDDAQNAEEVDGHRSVGARLTEEARPARLRVRSCNNSKEFRRTAASLLPPREHTHTHTHARTHARTHAHTHTHTHTHI